MGRLITVNNNSSDSDNKNAKKKISFDINSVKEQAADDSESSETKMPVFSIRKPQAKSEKNPELENSQVPTSEQPVFEIHNDEQSQEKNNASVLASSSPASAAPVVDDDEEKPQITVQSKIPAASDSAESKRPKSDFGTTIDDDLKTSWEKKGETFPVSSVASESPSANEDQTSLSESIQASFDSLDSLNRDIERLQKEIDAASASSVAESEVPSELSTNDDQSMTREAYRDSMNTVQDSEDESVEQKEEQPQQSNVSRPRPPRPQKVEGEKVEPIIVTPEEEKQSKPKVEWNGPEIKREEKQPVKKVERRETSHQQPVTRRSSHHAKQKPQKQSGVLGKSFLTMFGLGNKR